MVTLWSNISNGTYSIVADGFGNIVDCATCPCSSSLPITGLYVLTLSGDLWNYDGTTWVLMAGNYQAIQSYAGSINAIDSGSPYNIKYLDGTGWHVIGTASSHSSLRVSGGNLVVFDRTPNTALVYVAGGSVISGTFPGGTVLYDMKDLGGTLYVTTNRTNGIMSNGGGTWADFGTALGLGASTSIHGLGVAFSAIVFITSPGLVGSGTYNWGGSSWTFITGSTDPQYLFNDSGLWAIGDNLRVWLYTGGATWADQLFPTFPDTVEVLGSYSGVGVGTNNTGVYTYSGGILTSIGGPNSGLFLEFV